MKLLLVHGEGLGNIIEVLPLLKVLDRTYGTVDIALSNASFNFPREVFKGRKVYLPGENVPNEYDGKVVTIWGSIHGKNILPEVKILNNVQKQHMRYDQSEVSVYLNAARELGIPESEFNFDCKELLGFSIPDKKFDIVISNGYNWKVGNLWKAKSYDHYEKVFESLKSEGLSVCSIGHSREHIPGTTDMTGIGLMETLGLIEASKVVIANDSGFYHCACAFRKPCVVLFTFTSVIKNYDTSFHETGIIIRNEVDCQDICHARHLWENCVHHRCREIDQVEVSSRVIECINKGL